MAGNTFITNNPRVNVLLQYHDCKIELTYLDAGTDDERIHTVTWSSISAGNLSITATLSYEGTSGNFRIKTVQYS